MISYPKILIISIPGDFHSSAVSWALRSIDVPNEVIFPGDIPDFAKISIEISNNGCEAFFQRIDGTEVSTRDVKLVWNRRVGYPPAPARADEHDREVVESSYRFHIDNFLAILASQAIVVNSPAHQYIANKKALQLATASKVGMTIPDTCISNDFDRVALFKNRHESIVSKMFYTRVWRKSSEIYTAFTAKIENLSENDRDSIDLCPNIFQNSVDHESEVRLIVFGEEFYGLEMRKVCEDTSGITDSIHDSRLLLNYGRLGFRKAIVPDGVRRQVLAYMSLLGLHYGAFDFLVTENGSWTFLECNEGGQFLFVEEYIPDIGLLGGFARWFASLAGFQSSKEACELSLSEFYAANDAKKILDEPFSHNNFLAYRPVIDEGS